MGVVLSTFLIGYGSRRVGRYLEAPALATAAREITNSARPQVGAYEYFTPSLVYYVGDRVEKLVLPADVGQFFRDNPEALVITREDRLHFLLDELPPGIEILHRQARFLRPHRLVTLGRPRQPLAAVAGNVP